MNGQAFGGTATAPLESGVTVVMACHTERRLESIRSALSSLREQSIQPMNVVVAVDNNTKLARTLRDEFEWLTVVVNDGERGASATRNCGVAASSTSITAFLDDDETADSDWLRLLTAPFAEDPSVVGTGGRYEPRWLVERPRWFPDEFAWVVGGSYLGMPTSAAKVRNVWSGNMAVRTEAFRMVGGFRTDFGKCDAASQPEDTDLCIRMSAATGGHWIYLPEAVIHHDVPADRASLSFYVRRCYAEGAGKAAMQRRLNDPGSVNTENAYVRDVLNSARSRPNRQGAAMLLGVASAGVGFVRGRTIERPLRGARK